jgi:hypothetical protein
MNFDSGVHINAELFPVKDEHVNQFLFAYTSRSDESSTQVPSILNFEEHKIFKVKPIGFSRLDGLLCFWTVAVFTYSKVTF